MVGSNPLQNFRFFHQAPGGRLVVNADRGDPLPHNMRCSKFPQRNPDGYQIEGLLPRSV
jgi:hypothetical protein